MNERTQKLRNIMSANNLSIADVAKIINRKPQTVRVWRCRTSASRVIPDHALALLETKIETNARGVL